MNNWKERGLTNTDEPSSNWWSEQELLGNSRPVDGFFLYIAGQLLPLGLGILLGVVLLGSVMRGRI